VLTDYRSGWTDCEICKKDVDAKPNLSWMTKSHLKIAKTLSRKDPMTVKDDGVMVDELDEAVVTVMTPWTGYDRDSVRSSQMKYRRSGILQTTKIFQTAQSSIAAKARVGWCKDLNLLMLSGESGRSSEDEQALVSMVLTVFGR